MWGYPKLFHRAKSIEKRQILGKTIEKIMRKVKY